jgi:hypothetical protein
MMGWPVLYSPLCPQEKINHTGGDARLSKDEVTIRSAPVSGSRYTAIDLPEGEVGALRMMNDE